ncbi:YncE family protein [Paraburkholderia sacchari]|uniref:YncE family protein n=1 Tax=Paraburkholderia sacchari TaxID=159450 RepID=UPI001BCB449D
MPQFPIFTPPRNRVAAAVFLGSLVFSALAHAGGNAGSNDKVIVLDSGEAKLSLIDQNSRSVVGTEPTGKEPHHLMITPDGQSLIVADSVSNDLMFLDPHTGKVQRRVEGIEDPYQLGFSPDHKWFVTAGLRLDRVDIYGYNGRDVSLVKRIPLGKTPSHINFTSDSKLAFVTLQDTGEVAAIDLATQSVAWKLPVGKTPAGLWMTPGDKYLLVGMTGEDDVAVVDWRNRTVVKRIQTGRGAHNFRNLDDGKHVAVSNRVESTISILDYTTLTKVADITGLRPGPDDMQLSADKRYLWVTFRFARHVGIIDLTTNKLIDTIPVGRSPHGIYFANSAPVYAPNPD